MVQEALSINYRHHSSSPWRRAGQELEDGGLAGPLAVQECRHPSASAEERREQRGGEDAEH